MRTTVKTVVSRLLTVAVVAAVALPGAALGDKDLIEMRGAPPNVLIILDGSATMVHDPETNSDKFFTSGDHPQSKLYQAKRVLQRFVPSVMGQFNMGMTYTDLPERAVFFLTYVYSVQAVCTDPAAATCADTMTLDGRPLGERLRLGDDTNHHNIGVPLWPIHFGMLGDEMSCRHSLDGTTWADVSCSAVPTDLGSYKVESVIIDPTTGAAKGAAAPFYYPAYDWALVPQWLKDGIQGTRPWPEIAEAAGLTVDIYNPTWKQAIHDAAMAALEAARLGADAPLANGQVLIVKQVKSVRQNASDGNPRWNEVATRYVPLRYEERFVVTDRSDTSADDSQMSSSSTFTGVYAKSYGGDGGYRSAPGTAHDPLVGIPPPNPTSGGITYDPATYRNELLSILQPQPTPFFFFPVGAAPTPNPECNDNPYYRPCNEDWQIPLTGGLAAGGRKNLAQAWSAAANYFADVVAREDPFGPGGADCRNNYIIAITDGLQHEAENYCSNLQAHLRDIPVYIVGFGPASSFEGDTNFTCNDVTGGESFIAENATELADMLTRIQVKIEERTRAFAALAVSSVQSKSEQKMFIGTFYPWEGRSVWQGHLHAYLVDPITGAPPLDENNRPDESQAQWDAGLVLSNLAASSRAMYFDDPAVPGTRYVFDHTDSTARTKLQQWIPDRTTLDVGLSNKRHEFQVDETIQVGARTARVISWSHERNTFDGFMEIEILTGTWVAAEVNGQSVTGQSSGITATVTSYESRFESTVDFVRGVRNAALYDTDGMSGGIEKMGDVFHSIPQLVGTPNCIPCLTHNLEGYRADFFEPHARRRFVLFVGANDGALHAFDAGLWDTTDGNFDNGTGDELFAWVPREVMGQFGQLATGTGHEFTVDGTPTVTDVFIDHDGNAATAPTWRTMLYVGLRRGGASVLALDVTQPDTYTDGVPAPNVQSGRRLPSCASNASGCSGQWPAFKWEFQDLVADTADSDSDGDTSELVRADADSNLSPDLGETWSRPLTGFIKVLPEGETDVVTNRQTRSVVIFGGGRSPDGTGGNWVYILDAGSGAVLQKVQTVGMVTGQVSATDDNVDGVLERLYWATTAGRVYRMSLPLPLTLEADGSLSGWASPELVLDAGPSYPFYLTPTLVAITANADGTYRYAIVIGSGNRDDIMERSSVQRFFAFTDQGANTLPLGGADGSLLATHLQDVSTPVDPVNNYLQNHPTKDGWFFDLSGEWEKVNTRAVVYRGEVVFSTFTPSDQIETVTLDDGTTTCKMRGDAKTYSVLLMQGNPTHVDGETGADDRYVAHDSAIDMMSDTLLYATAAGTIVGDAMGDDTGFNRLEDWGGAPVNVTSWKEE